MADTLQQIWTYLVSVSDQFVGLAFTVFAALIFYLFRPRTKLQFGRAHSSRHVLNLADPTKNEPENPLGIYNEQFFIHNAVRKPAKDVEIVLTSFPRNVVIAPARKIGVDAIEDVKCRLTVPYITAGELLTLDCVYLNQRAAFIETVRCEDGIGKMVEFFTVRRFPQWFYNLLAVLILFGIGFVIQMAIQLFVGN